MSPTDPSALLALLRKGPVLLDAAVGTELTRRGADTSPPLWSARAIEEAPEILSAVHEDDAAAGADLLTAATFRTHRRSLARAGREGDAARWTRDAVRLAREGGERGRRRAAESDRGRPVFVAGSLAPLEECYRPELVPDDETLAREHAESAEHLAAAGVDLVLVETMNTAREAVAASRVAAATGLPVAVSFVSDGSGRLLSGEPIAEAAHALLALSTPPVALGINCVAARRLAHDLSLLAEAAPGLPHAAYGNTGRPLDGSGTQYSDPIAPDEYAEIARSWLRAGVRLVGGCCGTTATHTRALRSLLYETRLAS
jgi:S-methylmethionine-dependent homocysteine/selenocysteine methylase